MRALLIFLLAVSVSACAAENPTSRASVSQIIAQLIAPLTRSPEETSILKIYNEYLRHQEIDTARCSFEVMQEYRAVMRDAQQSIEPVRNPESKCLDAYSFFLSPEETTLRRGDTEGYGGVGLRIEPVAGEIIVREVFSNGPAKAADIREGDVLVQIQEEGKPSHMLNGLSARDAVKLLRGPPGTKLHLVIRRGGALIRTEAISRRRFDPQTVSVKYLSWPLAYMKASSIAETTERDFASAMEQFERNGRKCVMLDLRNNPGGFVHTTRRFLYRLSTRQDDVIISLRFNRGNPISVTIRDELLRIVGIDTDQVNGDDLPGAFESFKIVVLVNKRTASAAEIISGTMKDWSARHKNFLIVGERTYGKGTGQTLFELPGGGQFNLTTFEYMVGNERARVDGIGVEPHVVVLDTRTPPTKGDTSAPRDLQYEEGLKYLRTMCAAN